IRVVPFCYGADVYVRRPQPIYNPASRTLSLPVFRETDNSLIPIVQIPAEVHFSPQLRHFLKEVSDHRRQNISESGETFQFTFTEEIERLPDNGGEFSLSVAGVPHAWAWRLTNDNRIEPLGIAAKPELQTELDTGKIVPLKYAPVLLLGKDGLDNAVEPRVYLHGGDWQSWQRTTLNIQLLKESPSGDPTSLAEFSELTAARHSSISFQPGENGAWNVSTTTTPWSGGSFSLNQNGLRSGRYAIRAQLSYFVNNAMQTADSTTRFVVDDTEPQIGELRITGRDKAQALPFDQPLKGELLDVVDAESGVVLIEVGLIPDKLKEVWSSPSSSGPMVKPTSTPWQISPLDFGEIPASPADVYRTLTVHARITNAAGKFALIQQDVRIVRRAGSAPDENRGPVPGSMAFPIEENVRGTVIITVDGSLRKTGKAGDVLRFTGLKEGQGYSVRCEIEDPVLKVKMEQFVKNVTLGKEGFVRNITP
ncbi:MAG: hypothetical protein KDA85_19870, partial [Planctomycetaceae bacterium]|nr:hypothetical protein [Planctomycetaceae bacterium]